MRYIRTTLNRVSISDQELDSYIVKTDQSSQTSEERPEQMSATSDTSSRPPEDDNTSNENNALEVSV